MGGSSFCLWITFSKDGKVRNVIPGSSPEKVLFVEKNTHMWTSSESNKKNQRHGYLINTSVSDGTWKVTIRKVRKKENIKLIDKKSANNIIKTENKMGISE